RRGAVPAAARTPLRAAPGPDTVNVVPARAGDRGGRGRPRPGAGAGGGSLADAVAARDVGDAGGGEGPGRARADGPAPVHDPPALVRGQVPHARNGEHPRLVGRAPRG